jgi:hypothetical protein
MAKYKAYLGAGNVFKKTKKQSKAKPICSSR